MRAVEDLSKYPEDFAACIRFHGHVCPGLAIGYKAAQAARESFGAEHAEDEELVAVVENSSCSVDAIQVMLGCTFGKGNFFFNDWGKQVFTFFDRNSGKAIRVSFKGLMPLHEERDKLQKLVEEGKATDEDKRRFERMREEVTEKLINEPVENYFNVEEVDTPAPARAQIVDTVLCPECGEPVMTTRLEEKQGLKVCKHCA